ncbi:MAG: tRNA (adenosine(37)-N6)-threonylcarbamoyltransferase complex dimerization subunit type 1 TsaB [Pseudoruegeria sp.]
MSESLILAFDTSAPHCAVSLLKNDQIIVSRQENMTKGQAERIMLLIQEVLQEANVGFKDLTTIGVGIGPGNFTGIRISVSAARGLKLALGIPVVGVSTLEAMSYGYDGVRVSVMDAKRGNFYVQIFDGPNQQEPLRCTSQDMPRPPVGTQPRFLGTAETIAELTDTPASQSVMPLTDAIAHIAQTRTHSELSAPSPLYLRAPDAAPSRDTAPQLIK